MSHKGLTINIKGSLMDFDEPKVMGILNVTPDSFYKESRKETGNDILKRVSTIIEEGADIIDIGGCSTRPGSVAPSLIEEENRVYNALEIIRTHFPDVIISVDTWRSSIAARAIEDWGADIINDVSGGKEDPELPDVVAYFNVPYVLTHTVGLHSGMEIMDESTDVTARVITDLSKRLYELREKKINDIIIDPGIGFAKTPDQSLRLIGELEEICRMGEPVLVGLSRKSLIWKTLGVSPEDSLEGTVALDAIALYKGADIVRVHDVRAAVHTVKLMKEMKNSVRC